MTTPSPWAAIAQAHEEQWFKDAEKGIRDTYVYRYYDADDALLYVGQTGNPARRHSSHRSNAAWFDLVARRELRGPVTKAWALMEEFVALGVESPRYNAQARNGHAGPGSDHWAEAMAVAYRELLNSDAAFCEAQQSWLAGRLSAILDQEKAA